METVDENMVLDSELPKHKLFIPLICYNQNTNSWFMMSILKLTLMLREKNIEAVFYPVFFESLISRARNSSLAHFMGSDATHILFLDSDIVFDPESILKLLNYDKEIIGATYPKKYMKLDGKYPFDFTVNGLLEKVDIDDLYKVTYLPSGFSLIKRSAVEKMMNDNPSLKYVNNIDGYKTKEPNVENHFYNLYNCGNYLVKNPQTSKDELQYLSEDYGFCSYAIKSNIDIFMDASITLRHCGIFGYEGCFKDLTSSIALEQLQEKQKNEQEELFKDIV